MSLDDRQWRVVWIAGSLVLALWSSTAEQSIQTRIEVDPVLASIKKSNLAHVRAAFEGPVEQRAGEQKVAQVFYEAIGPRVRALRWAEYQPRVAAAVVTEISFSSCAKL